VNKRKSSNNIENTLVNKDSSELIVKRRRTESDSKSNAIVVQDVSESIQIERSEDVKTTTVKDQRIKELRRIEKSLLEVSFDLKFKKKRNYFS